MAKEKEAAEFNAIIQADREKKKKQQLADKIFGSGRRSSAPGPGNGNGRKAPTGPASLASRVGITKPSAGARSNTNNNASRYPTSFKPQVAIGGRGGNQQRAVSTPHLNRRNQILSNVVNGGGNASQDLRNQINVTRQPLNGAGISIRGMGEQASTFTVIAQNFAPGTTAADIESVLAPEPGDTGLIRCRLIASNPTVIAELVFSKKDTADAIITTFNNKKADGRLLHVYLQNSRPDLIRPRAPPASTPVPAPIHATDEDMIDAEDRGRTYDNRRPAQAPYTPPRGPRAEATIQDGRYGFSDDAVTTSDSSYQDNRRMNQFDRRGRGGDRQGGGGDGGGLVSDSMLSRNDRFDSSRNSGRYFRR